MAQNLQLIFTARKRSLCQGNIFTHVRHSVREGGGPAYRWGCLPTEWGGGLPRGDRRSAYRGGGSVYSGGKEGLPTEGGWADPLPRNQKSGRYASYWNTFL